MGIGDNNLKLTSPQSSDPYSFDLDLSTSTDSKNSSEKTDANLSSDLNPNSSFDFSLPHQDFVIGGVFPNQVNPNRLQNKVSLYPTGARIAEGIGLSSTAIRLTLGELGVFPTPALPNLFFDRPDRMLWRLQDPKIRQSLAREHIFSSLLESTINNFAPPFVFGDNPNTDKPVGPAIQGVIPLLTTLITDSSVSEAGTQNARHTMSNLPTDDSEPFYNVAAMTQSLFDSVGASYNLQGRQSLKYKLTYDITKQERFEALTDIVMRDAPKGTSRRDVKEVIANTFSSECSLNSIDRAVLFAELQNEGINLANDTYNQMLAVGEVCNTGNTVKYQSTLVAIPSVFQDVTNGLRVSEIMTNAYLSQAAFAGLTNGESPLGHILLGAGNVALNTLVASGQDGNLSDVILWNLWAQTLAGTTAPFTFDDIRLRQATINSVGQFGPNIYLPHALSTLSAINWKAYSQSPLGDDRANPLANLLEAGLLGMDSASWFFAFNQSLNVMELKPKNPRYYIPLAVNTAAFTTQMIATGVAQSDHRLVRADLLNQLKDENPALYNAVHNRNTDTPTHLAGQIITPLSGVAAAFLWHYIPKLAKFLKNEMTTNSSDDVYTQGRKSLVASLDTLSQNPEQNADQINSVLSQLITLDHTRTDGGDPLEVYKAIIDASAQTLADLKSSGATPTEIQAAEQAHLRLLQSYDLALTEAARKPVIQNLELAPAADRNGNPTVGVSFKF